MFGLDCLISGLVCLICAMFGIDCLIPGLDCHICAVLDLEVLGARDELVPARFRARREHLQTFYGPLPESQCQNLAVTVLYVPCKTCQSGLDCLLCALTVLYVPCSALSVLYLALTVLYMPCSALTVLYLALTILHVWTWRRWARETNLSLPGSARRRNNSFKRLTDFHLKANAGIWP